jgi:D-alanine-D-alanine ligase
MKILLLAGGDSSEREVSLDSGKAVFDSLKKQGHVVFAIDPATGKSLLGSDGNFIEYKADEKDKTSSPTRGTSFSFPSTIGSPAFHDIEIVFITLHGGSGEGGMLQGLLEIAGKKHTGSNMTASAIAMDKAISKRLCLSEGIKTPDFALFRISSDQIDNKLLTNIDKRFDYPLIVKPNDGGSTIGLSKVESKDQIKEAFKSALQESNNIIVEKYISGREITAAVLDGKALPLVEIIPKSGLYDYQAKYEKGMSEYIAPAKLNKKITSDIQDSAVRVYNMIGCAGLSRVDFILDENNDIYFLELNSLPGMTELSLAPMAAKADGMNFDNLLDTLINSAVLR